MATEFIELAGKVNQQMPQYCVQRIEQALNDAGRPVRSSRIALLGVSYKSGVGDIRESPALRIIELLQARGAVIEYDDPYVPALPHFGLEHVDVLEHLDGYDAAVIVTAHPGIDYGAVLERSAVLVDLRGVTRRRPRTERRDEVEPAAAAR